MGPEVRFSTRIAALNGILGGILIAVGLPYVILVYGQNLGAAMQAVIIILALLSGGTLSTVSVFFGIVIPSKVGAEGQGWPFSMGARVLVEKKPNGEKKVVVEPMGTSEKPNQGKES